MKKPFLSLTLISVCVFSAVALPVFAPISYIGKSVSGFFEHPGNFAPDDDRRKAKAIEISAPQATYFSQDFSSSNVVSSYVSATPNSGQFNALGASGGGTVVSITDGRLQFARTSNFSSFSRTSDFSPIPTVLKYSLDLGVTGNSTSFSDVARFQVGSGFGTAHASEGSGNVHSQFGISFTSTSGEFRVRDIGLLSNSTASFSGTQRIEWFINNSGSSLSYVSPSGSIETVASDRADLWVGNSLVFNEIVSPSPTQPLTDLKFAFIAGSGTIQIDNIQVEEIPPPPPVPDYVNLQWPPTISGTGGQQSETIFGQIWEPGVTDSPGQGAGVIAEVGYGPLGSDPRNNPSWVFTAAVYGGDVGNNDEYDGTFTLPSPASQTQYAYTYRYSLDAGANWTYGDLDGNGQSGGLTFDPALLGTATVDPAPPPGISVSGGPLNFGDQAVSTTSSSQSIMVTNTGAGTLVLGTPLFTTGTQFAFTADPNGMEIAPTESAFISFTFTPTSAGTKTDTVTINSNAPGSPPNISLTGQGVPSISGTVNIGAGQTYTNLTNNDGLFQALNNDLVLTGDLTVNITGDLTGETGFNSLRNLTETGAGAGTYRILIKPSGGPRTISGSIAGELIKLNGADRVTIDGWTGSAIGVVPDPAVVTRDLTITNTSTDPFASMVFFYNGLGNPSQFNIIQNVNIVGNSTSYTGIAFGGNGGGLGGGNDFNRALNNSIKSVRYGIYVQGQSEALPDISTQIVDNDLSATGSDAIRQIGIVAVNQQNMQIRRNKIYVNRGGQPGGAVGIGLGADMDSKIAYNASTSGGIINGIVAQNRITGVVGSSLYGAHGIAVAGASTGTNRLSNNMISGVIGAPSSPDLTTGVFIAGVPGSSTYLNYNSIAMTGDRGSGAVTPSYALAMGGSDPTVELKNNIFYTSQVATGGSGVSYAIGTAATSFANLNSNYNAFYHSGSFGYRVGSLLAGTQIADLSIWQAAVTDDASSQEVDPLFVDPVANLHLQDTSPVIDDGIDVGTVADIDGDPRPLGAGYDIGADEVVPVPDIDVRGNNVSIVDGDSTPSLTDHTDFGPTNVSTGTVVRTFAIHNTGTANLNIGAITLGGTNAGDFSIDNTGMSPILAPGGNTAFNVIFDPSLPGLRTASVSIVNDDADENPYDFDIQGTGTEEDTTPPDTTITNGPSGVVTSSTATFDFASSEGGSTYECSLDGAAFGACSSGIEYTGLANGNHYFQVRATDGAGNTDGSPASRTWTIRAGDGAVSFVVDRLDDSASADECITAMTNDCSLRRAIGTANDGDTITFDPALFSSPAGASIVAAPQTIVLGGTAINVTVDLTITGPGSDQLTIDANGASRVFAIGQNVTVNMSGMTVTGGNGLPQGGGGIFIDALSDVSLTGMTITGNTAARGGGILALSPLTITDSVISGNSVNEVGGGIRADWALTITNSTISGNTAGTGAGIFGSVEDGGDASLTVSGSTFYDNCSGTRLVGGACGPSGGGGAIEYNTGVNPFTIENSTFSGNSAGLGGGIAYFGTAGSVKSTTFVNSSIFSISLPMSNTIISGGGCTAGIVDLGYNLDSGNSCGFTQATSKINTDPMLGPLQNNGGPTLTHGFNLALGLSPAIDAGSAFGLTTDQRGMPRTIDIPGVANAAGGDGTDIGAFEIMAPTAAPVSISGTVRDRSGRAISGAVITVQGIDGVTKSAMTGTIGYYRVEGLTAGASYFVTVSSRRHTFADGTRFVNLEDNLTGLDFTASP